MGIVRLYATLRQHAGGDGAVDVAWSPGDTIADVLSELLRQKPDLDGLVLDAEGNVIPHVGVFLNGRDIRHLDGLESRVEGDSEISVFPPVAGG